MHGFASIPRHFPTASFVSAIGPTVSGVLHTPALG
jgi:hypothetical protein